MRFWPIGRALQQEPASRSGGVVPSVDRWERVVWPNRSIRGDLETASRVSLIYSCLEERANSIAAVEPEVWRGDMPAVDPDLTRILMEPDEGQTWIDWWRAFWLYHDSTGNVYVYRRRGPAGRVVWYELLRPDLVRVKGRAGVPAGYLYGPYGSGTPLALEDVAHFRSRDLLNDYYGIGPVGILMREADIDYKATTFTAEWVLNKGRSPGGYLTTDQDIDDDEVAARVKRTWGESLAAQSAGDIALLVKGLKYESASPMTSPEMAGLRALTESRIVGAFGIDGRLVSANFAVQSSSGTADFSVARRVLWEDTLVPMYRRLEAFMTGVVQQDFGPEISWRFNLSGVPALRESEDARSDRVSGQWESGLRTFDETRVALGLAPVGGARGASYGIDSDEEAAGIEAISS